MFLKRGILRSLRRLPRLLPFLKSTLVLLVVFEMMFTVPLAALAQPAGDQAETIVTTSPIKHVIVIIGENRTFDHIFATYKPKGGEQIDNLLYRHIIKADGTPGKNYSAAVQDTAVDTSADGYQ